MALPPPPPAWIARATALGLNADETVLFEVVNNHNNITEDQFL